jgi:hypothetical protein
LNGAFENFSMYGFAIDYPAECRVEFNSKSRREMGDVVFRFPENVRIFLSWGELEKVSKRFSSAEEHANYSLDAMQKGKNVKNFERVLRDTVPMHSHNSSVNKVKFDEKGVKFLPGSKDLPREAYSFHVHCDKSKRYFVLYTMAPANEVRYDRMMDSMRESFKCH